MKREILFRGKRVDNGEWVYGFLAEADVINTEYRDDSVGYLAFEEFRVDPETVGQFSGLRDRNGNAIYEGDIVNDKVLSHAEVRFLNASFVIYHSPTQHWVIGQRRALEMCVIGNIYEPQPA